MTSIDETLEFIPSWNEDGLIPAIAQDFDSKDVLMMAWMNEEALQKTLDTKEVHYWSRSRQQLWHKGATSGAIQKVQEILIDCDQDVILLTVKQQSKGACHTGRTSCFYRSLQDTNKLKEIERKS